MINIIDLKELKQESCRVQICQLYSDDFNWDKEKGLYFLRYDDAIINKILLLLDIAKQNDVNIVVFPELSIPKELITNIKEWSRVNNTIVICGSHYHIVDSNFISRSPIIINGVDYYTDKLKPAPIEKSPIKGEGLVPGVKISKFINTKYGNIGILICSDYLDEEIKTNLKLEDVDMLFVPSFQKDSTLYHNRMAIDCENSNEGIYILYSNFLDQKNGDGKSSLFGMTDKLFSEKFKEKKFTDLVPTEKLFEFSKDIDFAVFDLKIQIKRPFINRNLLTEPNVTFINKSLSTNIVNSQKELSTKKDDDISSEEDLIAAIKVLLDKKNSLNFSSSKEHINTIRSLKEKIFSKLDIQANIDAIPIVFDNYLSGLFDNILFYDILPKTIKEEILHIRNSDDYKWYHRSIIVSALTLSLLKFKKLDQNKILLLIDFIKPEEEKVWQKAITGLTLALTYRKNSWLRYNLVIQGLQGLKASIKVQNAIKSIAYVIEVKLYNLFANPDSKAYNIDFFNAKPSNFFIPFYENNVAIQYFLENSNSADSLTEIANIIKSPLPDVFKYIICYSDFKKEKNVKIKNTKYINYLFSLSQAFEPYLQFLNELYIYITEFPVEKQEEVFSKELSVASTSLKDHVLNEANKHSIQGVHYMKIKDMHNAISHFNQTLRYAANDKNALFNLADCYSITENIGLELEARVKIDGLFHDDENVSKMSKIYSNLGEFTKAIDICTKLINKKSRLKESYECRANCQFKLSEYQKALDDCTEFIQLFPSDKTIYCILGLLQNSDGNFVESIKSFKEAILYNDNDLNSYANLALAYMNIENYHEGLTYANIAIEKDKEYIYAYEIKGSILERLERYNEAIEVYRKGLNTPYNKHSLHIALSALYLEINELDKAGDETDLALKCALNDIDRSKCYVYKAYILSERMDAESLNLFQKAADFWDKLDLVYLGRAAFYTKMKKHKEALQEIDTLLDYGISNVSAYANKGMIYEAMSEYEKGIFEINKAIELSPALPILYIHRASLYKKKKDWKNAEDDYMKCLSMSPNSDHSFMGLSSLYRLQGKIEEAFEFARKIKNQKSSYYCTLAEIYSSLGQEDMFFTNINIAFEKHLKLSDIDVDVYEKYKNDSHFLEILRKYKQTPLE